MTLLTKLLERLGWLIPDEPAPESGDDTPRRPMVTHTLRDRRDKLYTMAIDRDEPFGSRWWVVPEGRRKRGQHRATGYVEALRMSDDPADTLTISDIRVEDISDRHNGLGTAMLRTLFRIARLHKVRYLHGFVTRADQLATPGLLDWYRREGFTVESGSNSALISIDLQRVPTGEEE